jgi:hypothetical protein
MSDAGIPHDHQHDHDHHHGNDHGHGHSHDIPLAAGPKDDLYTQIDTPNVESFNAVGGTSAGQGLIKWVSELCLLSCDAGDGALPYPIMIYMLITRPWEEREDEILVSC